MNDRAIAAASAAWAGAGFLLAVAGLGTVNDDARTLVISATVLGVGCALAASALLVTERHRWAGACLVVSAVIPTWFAAWLNVLPLVAGILLISGVIAAPRGPSSSS